MDCSGMACFYRRACSDTAVAKRLEEMGNPGDSRMRDENRKLSREVAALLQKIDSMQRESEVARQGFEKSLRDSISSIKRSSTWVIGSVLVFPVAMFKTALGDPAAFFRNPLEHCRVFFRHHFSLGKDDVCLEMEQVLSGSGPAVSPEPGTGLLGESVREPACSGGNAVSPRLSSAPGKPVKFLRELIVAAVVDEFTGACFGPDVRLVHLTPGNWEDVFGNNDIDLLFVESAWCGRHNSWEGIIPYADRPENSDILRRLAEFSSRQGVPSVFWSKEDPPDYEVFRKAASFFDYVFTSDANLIPRYSRELGRTQVYALPFAAQPAIHNPIGKTEDPGKDLLFAGAWYKRHRDRLIDYERVLDPALNFEGFHIYDRMHGSPREDLFGFPERFHPFIRGKLPYYSLLREYKKYRLFLNVNSVQDSPTMFSRRVFEVLLSGTPVISGYSLGIDRMLGGDIVQMVSTPEEGLEAIRNLLDDRERRQELGRLGVRRVMEGHTYEDRLKSILDKVGISYEGVPGDLAIWSLVESREELKVCLDNFQRQVFRSGQLRYYLVTPDPSLASASPLPMGTRVLQLSERGGLPQALDSVLNNSAETYLAFMDPGDYYGSFYVMDMCHALRYSGSRMVGKSGFIFYGSDGFLLNEQRPGDTYLGNEECELSSAVFERSFPVRLQRRESGWMITGENRRWYSHNSYGLVKGRDATSLSSLELDALGRLGHWMR